MCRLAGAIRNALVAGEARYVVLAAARRKHIVQLACRHSGLICNGHVLEF